jgi:hypothetical protein
MGVAGFKNFKQSNSEEEKKLTREQIYLNLDFIDIKLEFGLKYFINISNLD